jgi:hypothetical protein
MKMTIALVALALSTTVAAAQFNSNRNNNSGLFGSNSGGFGSGSNSSSHQSDGYTTNRGTYVEPHRATNPNNTQMDNYNTRGNVNPYSGAVGTRSPRY